MKVKDYKIICGTPAEAENSVNYWVCAGYEVESIVAAPITLANGESSHTEVVVMMFKMTRV